MVFSLYIHHPLLHIAEESEQWEYLGCSRKRRGGFWQERGREGDEAARGGGMLSALWVWSRQVEECACTPAASLRINGVSVKTHSGTQDYLPKTGKQTVSILIYLFILYVELSLLLWKSYRHK